ncbi:hypothetical protein QAD02_018842 [Eretmocerus hayati]|uniref:Uncharacterized protein n=1 Tax=Eretmocerus hayati TaxID=131215 RepID=A0ACC2PHH5_9HYME|nr:hypothetical protein QAD02_018842 [Eretmocerus hayati]
MVEEELARIKDRFFELDFEDIPQRDDFSEGNQIQRAVMDFAVWIANIRAYLGNRDDEVPPDFIVPTDEELLEIIGQGESLRVLRELVDDQLQRDHDDIEMGTESLNQSMLPSETNEIDDLESIYLLSKNCDESSPEEKEEKEDQNNPDYESGASDCDMQEVPDKSEDVQKQEQKRILMIVLSDDDDEKGDGVMEESVIELSGDSSSEDECTSRVATQTRACKRSRTGSTAVAAQCPYPATAVAELTPRGPTKGIDWFDECLKELVGLIREGHDLDEKVGLTIASDLFLQGPGWFQESPLRNFNYADLWRIFGIIAQSNKAFRVDETLQVVVSYSNQPVGSANPDDNDTLKHCYRKSMIKITNEDNLCLSRAIVCAIEYLKNSKTKASRQEVFNMVNQQTRALELCEKPGTSGYRRGSQEKPIYNGRDEFQSAVQPLRYKETIILALDEERSHYEPVINFLGVARFIQRHPTHRFACLLCNRSYKASPSHKCTEKCEACISSNLCEPALYDVPCNDCNRVFVSQKCFDDHKRRGSYYNNSKNAIATVCDKIRICVDCYKQYDLMFDKHECGVGYCVDCRSKHNPHDQCYIRVKAPVRVRDQNAPDYHPDNQFICFYIESEQDEKFKDNPDPNKIQYKHIVCLFVAQLDCDYGRGIEDLTQSCPYCGAREIPYKKRDNPVRKFLELILHHPEKGFARRIVFSHCSGVAPHVIMNGLQIKSVQIGNVVILDAHSFLTMELRAFPKAFGLADTKGFFPHKFNTKNNATYNDKLPAKEFYDPDNMSVNERAEFEEWDNDNLFYLELTTTKTFFNPVLRIIVTYQDQDIK